MSSKKNAVNNELPSPMHGRDRRASEIFDRVLAEEEAAEARKRESIFALIDEHIDRESLKTPIEAAPVAELAQIGGKVPDRRGSGIEDVSKKKQRREGSRASLRSAKVSVNSILVDVDSDNPEKIYDKLSLSVLWVMITVVVHSAQFAVLIEVSKKSINSVWMKAIIGLAAFVPFLLLSSLYFVKKKSSTWNIWTKYYQGQELRPSDEADQVQDTAVWLLIIAACSEGIAFAALTASSSNDVEDYSVNAGLYSQPTMLQILQFGAITFFSLHRCIRPANRCDPLRTTVELEIVRVCWDALDGATIFALMFDLNATGAMTTDYDRALRVLLGGWYLSVGARVAVMFMSMLPASSLGYRLILTPPLELAVEPTVDRTLQAMRNRSVVTAAMSIAEFYAAGIRIYLWSQRHLSQLQIEMTLKNIAFLFSLYGASDMYSTTKRRDWNTREIIGGIEYPSRYVQAQWAKWGFVLSYISIGAMLNYFLYLTSRDTQAHYWFSLSIIDVFLAFLFAFYCRRVWRKDTVHTPRHWCVPQEGFLFFPKKLAGVFSWVLGINMYVIRLPRLYLSYNALFDEGDDLSTTYSNALITLSLSVVVFACFSSYWYLCNLMFHHEFTASPGDYNSVHDPLISMVGVTTQVEGAMDILSCVVLMQLAASQLGDDIINHCVILFCMLEMVNACLSFSLLVALSNGADDTPRDLIYVKARLRSVRAAIDLGVLILRLVLWIRYNALTSVFLVKNLFNIVNTLCQVERYLGSKNYPRYTLFTEAVPVHGWYGMTPLEWRRVTGGKR